MGNIKSVTIDDSKEGLAMYSVYYFSNVNIVYREDRLPYSVKRFIQYESEPHTWTIKYKQNQSSYTEYMNKAYMEAIRNSN